MPNIFQSSVVHSLLQNSPHKCISSQNLAKRIAHVCSIYVEKIIMIKKFNQMKNLLYDHKPSLVYLLDL